MATRREGDDVEHPYLGLSSTAAAASTCLGRWQDVSRPEHPHLSRAVRRSLVEHRRVVHLPSSRNPINREMVYPGGNRPRSFRTRHRLLCAKFG